MHDFRATFVLLTALVGFAFSSPAIAQIVDADNDGLIDIDSLEKLNNIRYSLDGTSYRTASTPDGEDGDTSGCPEPENVCKGYELIADLDFDMNNNGPDAADPYYNDGEGWKPIGNGDLPFNAIFDGNGRTISNLFISREATQTTQVGLFGTVGEGGTIRNLGLTDVDITHKDTAGNAPENSPIAAGGVSRHSEYRLIGNGGLYDRYDSL